MAGYNRWTGAASGAPGTAGNWSAAAAPVNNDIVVIDGSSTVAINGGDLSAVTALSFDVMKDFEQTIGASGSQLKLNSANLNYYGRGSYAYINGTFIRVNVDTVLQGLNLDGTITLLNCIAGPTVFAGTATCTDAVTHDKSSLVVTSGTTFSGTLYMKGGYCYKNAAVPDIRMGAGAIVDCISGNMTGKVLMAGAGCRFNYYGGTITHLVIMDGVWDCTLTGATRTITNLTQIGGHLEIGGSGNSMTFSNAPKLLGGTRNDPYGSLTRNTT